MIEARYVFGNEAMQLSGGIRYEVFTEEQGVDIQYERDFYDYFAHHVVVMKDDLPLATGRLIFTNEVFLIGRVAVLKDHRGNNYGDLVVRMLIDRAFSIGADEVEVHAQLSVQGFYEGIGFIPIGEAFYEEGIEHIKMVVDQKSLQKSCQ
ncbi:GNAT family N-acetyltransferase [Petrocella sp. FN5]|uniref:GNAT family N-acetyltransferase n=1 Tax=Petrocella sp. FN5 TaxID=3032002 RepID=UPI0023DC9BF0|nr:GNAT family N-acetyltransferase [Petrocella sp. FN5]MDF1617422.1 GNAT family N-acetyltransferase [Petrocella sp. FN5]